MSALPGLQYRRDANLVCVVLQYAQTNPVHFDGRSGHFFPMAYKLLGIMLSLFIIEMDYVRTIETSGQLYDIIFSVNQAFSCAGYCYNCCLLINKHDE